MSILDFLFFFYYSLFMRVTDLQRSVYKKATLQELITLRLIEKKTLQQIADIYGTTRQAIYKRIKQHVAMLDPQRLQDYKDNKIAILTAAEREILKYLCEPKTLQKSNLSSLAMAFGIVYDKNRLESGLSTANISYEDIKAEEQRIREELLKVGKQVG